MLHSVVVVLEKLHSLDIGSIRVEFTQIQNRTQEPISFETRTEPAEQSRFGWFDRFGRFKTNYAHP